MKNVILKIIAYLATGFFVFFLGIIIWGVFFTEIWGVKRWELFGIYIFLLCLLQLVRYLVTHQADTKRALGYLATLGLLFNFVTIIYYLLAFLQSLFGDMHFSSEGVAVVNPLARDTLALSILNHIYKLLYVKVTLSVVFFVFIIFAISKGKIKESSRA